MIEIKNVKKNFNGKPILRGVDLNVHDKEILVIIGRSGCGKSILLRHIIGLVRPDEGEIWIDGKNVSEMSEKELYEIRKKIGMVFQGAALFDSMTIEENITLGLREHFKINTEDMDRIVAEKLKMVGLPGIEKMRPSELSGGMRKRVGLARAIAMDPKYVLYDEPTTGLDPIMTDTIDRLIMDLNKSLNITSIVVTHDMKSVYKIATRVAMLHRGVILFKGTSEELKNTTDPVVKQFIEGKAEGPIKSG